MLQSERSPFVNLQLRLTAQTSAVVIARQWRCGRWLMQPWSIRPCSGDVVARGATKLGAHRAGCYAHVDRRQRDDSWPPVLSDLALFVYMKRLHGNWPLRCKHAG
jgi:hypothetical protein